MPGPYVNAAEVSEQVNARLGNSPTNLEPPHWDAIARKAIGRGYQRILRAMVKRGYSITCIDAWDGRKQYNLDLAVAYAMLQRGFGNDDDRSALFKELDLLKEELDDPELILTDDEGTIILPDTTAGIASASDGRMEAFDDAVDRTAGW